MGRLRDGCRPVSLGRRASRPRCRAGDNRAVLPPFLDKLCAARRARRARRGAGAAGRVHERRVRHPAPRPRQLPRAGARARRQPGRRAQQRRLGARPRQGARPAAQQRGRPRLRAGRARERQPGHAVRRGDAGRAAEARAARTSTSRAATTTSRRSRRRAGAQLGRQARALPFVDGYSTTALVRRIRAAPVSVGVGVGLPSRSRGARREGDRRVRPTAQSCSASGDASLRRCVEQRLRRRHAASAGRPIRLPRLPG